MAPRRGPYEDDRESTGGFGADSILRGIGGFMGLISDMLAEGVDEWSRTGEIKGPGKGGQLRGVYGLSIRVGPGNALRFDNFGNIRREHGTPVIGGAREPLVDVFDEKEGVLVVAEMPGVSRDKVVLAYDGRVLAISADGPEHRYRRDVQLPRAVRFDLREVSYREGILKVWMPAVKTGDQQDSPRDLG